MMQKSNKQKWQFLFKDWIGGSANGVLLVGLRKNGRGPWLKAEDIPQEVREWFSLEKRDGAANLWTCPTFNSVEQFRKEAHCVTFQKSHKLFVKGYAEVEIIPPPMPEIEKLPCMKSHCDGAHCGLGDWYQEIEDGIKEALKRGRDAEWTTGWYGSKKEIASACITHYNRQHARASERIHVEVSVSDDFDTEGIGECSIPHTTNLEKIRDAIYKAWDEANDNQKDNRLYHGFSILHKHRYYSQYRNGKPYGKAKMRLGWVETLILPAGDAYDWDSPPGDNYHKWGFQGEYKIPKEIREKLEAWANDFIIGGLEESTFTYKGFTVKPWDD